MFRRWTYFYVKMLPWMNWSKGTLVGGRFDLRYLSIDQVKRIPTGFSSNGQPGLCLSHHQDFFFHLPLTVKKCNLNIKPSEKRLHTITERSFPFVLCPRSRYPDTWNIELTYFLNIWGILHPYFGRQLSGTNLDDEYLLKSHIVDIWIFISWKILKKSAFFSIHNVEIAKM